MRNSSDFFRTDSIIKILDGRKKEEIGFCVPQIFKEEFQKFVDTIEKKRRLTLLNRVSKAQKKDPIELDRLIRYQEETLRFIYDFKVPFTNNLAERDLRMIKVKQKISGTLASFTGAEFFCRIKSFIATLKKNSLSVLDGLRDAFQSQPMKTLLWC